LALVPAGGVTKVRLGADWSSPSFDGSFLPATSSLRQDGFDAEWTVSEFARPMAPLSFGAPPGELSRAAFGVTWFQPADGYLMTDRSLKYGFLFVALTFMAFFFFELTGARRAHLIQYGLVGGALCVFYLLLLSLAERTGFGPAYAVAATATTVQIALYGRALLDTWRRALVLGAVLTGLYGGLYLLVGLEEAALLVGSIALFTILALAMWLTRDVARFERPPADGAALSGSRGGS
jgi:inner membrane protein